MKRLSNLVTFPVFALASWSAAWLCPSVGAGELEAGERQVGIVSHVKVLSNRVEDVSSLEAWKKSVIKDGMSDKEKALAIWKTVVAFQHQDEPPVEYLQNENMVLDAIKTFNVYGYSMCGNAASHVQSLARYAGLEARGWTIQAHVVPEIRWDGKWHMLDASLINYFPKPDGDLASVEEIMAAVKEWYAKNPDLKGDDAKLRKFHVEGGWQGWKKGPELLANCPLYDGTGWLPAKTHGWYSTMQEYDGSTLFPYENGYSLGYQVNVQLRPGERLTRNWSNKGLHVRTGETGGPGCMKMKVGEQFLVHSPKFGDLAPGRVGNGVLQYNVPLAGILGSGTVEAENLDDSGSLADVRVKDPAKPAMLVFRMPSSYVYLTGELAFKAAVGEGGELAVSFSDNNGLDWKEIAKATASGDQKVDLKPYVVRRYDYRLRFALKGKGTGLETLKIAHDVQHSQRPLPALAQGSNTITFSAGPQEGTITIEGSTNIENKGKQLHYTDFHPERTSIKDDMLVLAAPKGRLMFPIETPGEMTRLRIAVFYRCRDLKDSWDVEASLDGGKTFEYLGRCEGPKVFFGRYFIINDLPRGRRGALVRFSGQQRTVAMIFNLRIDADYKEPAGGFRPVKVTYVWEENGVEKRDIHVAAKPEDTYTIRCETKPLMKSLIVELAE